MRSADIVLLLLNESTAVTYSHLLSRISGNYSSINSARAALSRTLRNLAAKGLIVKQQNTYFITTKGKKLIEKDMYTVLLLSLTNSIYRKDALKEIPVIVKQLSMLIEWSKLNKGLLETARQNQKLEVSNLKALYRDFKKKIKQEQYLSKVFLSQIKQLKKWDFRDSYVVYNEPENIKKLREFLKKTCEKEFFFQPGVKTKNFFNALELSSEKGIVKQKDFFKVCLENSEKIIDYLLEIKSHDFEKIFYQGIEIILTEKEITFMGQHKKILLLKKIYAS